MLSKRWEVGQYDLAKKGFCIPMEIGNAETGGSEGFKLITVNMLVDSGACRSAVRGSLLAAMQLPIVDYQRTSSAEGEGKERPLYRCWIRFPDFHERSDPWKAGCYLDIIGADDGMLAQGLLGRDLLAATRMIYDGLTGVIELHFSD